VSQRKAHSTLHPGRARRGLHLVLDGVYCGVILIAANYLKACLRDINVAHIQATLSLFVVLKVMFSLDMFLYIINGSFAFWTQVGGFQNCPLHIVSVASHVSKHRVFLFSHSRPSSLLYDPNMLLCVLGFVLVSDCCFWVC